METVSPPVVIEAHEDGQCKWSISFGGNDPTPDLNVEVDKETAWKLHNLIMRIESKFPNERQGDGSPDEKSKLSE